MNPTRDNPKWTRRLAELADAAGPGPRAADVLRWRYRRRGRRIAQAAASLLVLLGLVALGLRLTGPTPPPPVGTTALQPGTVCLPPGADRGQIHEHLNRFADTVQATGPIWIEKTPGDGVSYALAGPVPMSTEQLDAAVAELLKHYPIASIRLGGDSLRYSLISGRSDPTGPNG
jgi:hypothetical protein